jgi:membrane carboxypeptidase/penicillin-binding protein
VLVGALSAGAGLFTIGASQVYFDRRNLPDLGTFTRFEFPAIGRIYDANGQPLVELAREYRQVTRYENIPPVVRDAILATEDKRFFSHNGGDYFSIPRVIGKVRVGAWVTQMTTGNPRGPAIFPEGGSTITQQLVRGVFLQRQTSEDVVRTAHSLGVLTRLQPYATTALGASEVSLFELATAYRTIASGILAQPYVIRQIVRGPDDVISGGQQAQVPVAFDDSAFALIQEGLRGVVRLPTGTAHALDSSAFPIAVMGKTGTTNDFKDALFVGSTYGADGVTVAVRIGFDDDRSLGLKETGNRVALPVFQEVMLRIYHDQIVGPAPSFPFQMEQRITRYLQRDAPAPVLDSATAAAEPGAPKRRVPPTVAKRASRTADELATVRVGSD